MAIMVNLDVMMAKRKMSLDCQPGDILEYVPDDAGKRS